MGRFLVDGMCGRLARYLRFCGHDAAYATDRGLVDDAALVAAADAADRTIITRDRSLPAGDADVIVLHRRDIEGQLVEVAAAGVPLSLPRSPTRCGRCNGRLDRRPDGVTDPPYVPDDHDGPTFACRDCGQVFWRGSHWDRVARTIERALDADASPAGGGSGGSSTG